MRYSTGIGISSGGIHLIQLCYKNPLTIEITQFATQNFDAEAIIDGRIKNPFVVADALKYLVEKTNIKNKKVSIALPRHCIISKKIKLPSYLPEKETENEIIEHLKQYLPDIQEEISFDYIKADKANDSQEFMLFAARQSQVDSYLSIVAESQLKVCRVDVDIYAFMRGVKWHHSFMGHVIILNFNQDIQLTVVDGHEVIFTQTLMTYRSLLQLVREIRSHLETHAIMTHTIEKIITVGESPFYLDELVVSLNANMIKIKLDKTNLRVAPDFFVAFGLALGGNHV